MCNVLPEPLARRLGLFLAMLSVAAVGGVAEAQRASGGQVLDQDTARVLNSALGALDGKHYDVAANVLGRLDRRALSPSELARVEQILFNVAYVHENYAEARRHLDLAIESGGLSAAEIGQASYQRAQMFAAEGLWSDGAEALERWIAQQVEPGPAAYYLLGVAYYQMGDFDRALAPAREAVGRMTEPKESWIGLLLALELQREAYENAVPLLQRLIQLAPEKKTYWLQLSSVYGQLEDYPGALAAAQVAYNEGLLTEAPEIFRLASLQLYNGQPARCALMLEEAIDAGRIVADAAAYEKLANCWIAAAEVDRAVVPLALAAELDASGELFVRLGELDVEREDWAAAERALRRALELEPRDLGYAYFLLGVALFGDGRIAEARPSFLRASDFDAHADVAKKYLAVIDAELARSQW